MNDKPAMVQLPTGDLWFPPTYDADGNHIPRKDSVNVAGMIKPLGMNSPDIAAILMAENAKLLADAKAGK